MSNIDLEFITRIATAAVEAEREACIKVIQRFMRKEEPWSWEEVVEAIRERGEMK